MIFDDRSLADITPEDLRLYLQGARWTEEIVSDYLAVWKQEALERELYVPRSIAARDYRTQLGIVLGLLADVEDRQPIQVATDVRYTGADVMRLRIDTTAVDRSTISFVKAAEIIAESKVMLMSAARAAVHPQNFFSARPPLEVSEYLETTRLGQTEPGSFVFTIVSPVTYRPAQVAAQEMAGPDEARQIPFARRVTETLSKSLHGIREAATPRDRDLSAIFEDLVEEGVSANLCDALAVIANSSTDRAVELDFSWSAKAPRPQPRTTVTVPAMITSVLSDMSKHLKAIAPEPGYEVLGRVERLSDVEPGAGFDLALRATVEGRERLLALELTAEERDVASTAWSTGRTVYTRGTLDKRFRPYRLLQPEVFELVEPPPE